MDQNSQNLANLTLYRIDLLSRPHGMLCYYQMSSIPKIPDLVSKPSRFPILIPFNYFYHRMIFQRCQMNGKLTWFFIISANFRQYWAVSGNFSALGDLKTHLQAKKNSVFSTFNISNHSWHLIPSQGCSKRGKLAAWSYQLILDNF